MKLYAPEYYKEFVCIADKCNHSCCIGWEIDVDSVALEKYKGLSHSYGKVIESSIEMDETPHFRLSREDRCPHLNSKGLCNIILNVGEEYLCDICREHPRFYNNALTHKEVGLGMACEEACRIILGSEKYMTFSEIGDIEGEAETTNFDSLSLRSQIYSVLSDSSVPYKDRLSRISKDYAVSPSNFTDDYWKDILSSLEYLDESHKAMFSVYSSEEFDASEYDIILERALAYYIYRHCTETADEYEFRVSLGFCLFCERLLASVLNSQNAKSMDDIIRIAVTISEEIEYSEDNTDSIKFEFSIM